MRKLTVFPLALSALCLACAPTPSSSSSPSEPSEPSSISSSEEPRVIEYDILPDEEIVSGLTANDARFDKSKVEMVEDHPLLGKRIYWLGSSVTYGASSNGQSMADFLSAKTGATCVKDAVSGTTIYDNGGTGNSGDKSYTRRLVNSTVFKTDVQVDAFICQISTNDARNDALSHRGSISDDDVIYPEEFDRSTTLGGIEFIISYVVETWDCPIYFYSGSYFGDGSGTRLNNNPKGSEYGRLVDETKQIIEKWKKVKGVDIGIIDLFNDEEFNAKASDKYYTWATSDPIHPRKAGYLQWWMPYFEDFLLHNPIL